MLKSKRLILLILAALTVLCAALIIFFSSQPASSSAKQSSAITKLILRVTIPHFDTLVEKDQKALIKQYDPYVRKAAHVTEFCLFGLFLCLFLGVLEVKRFHLFSLCGGVLLATIDECRQLFSAGRGPRATDILIDSTGVALGILIAVLILRIITKKRHISAEKEPV